MPDTPDATAPDAAELTPRQAKFATEILTAPSATEAARRAGYAPESAHVAASRMLKNDKVRNVIDEGRQAAAERHEITNDKILQHLADVGFAAVVMVPDDKGRLHPADVAYSEKVQALDKLARAFGLYEKKKDREQTAPVSIQITRNVKAGP
jgi:phage terminase small subunit